MSLRLACLVLALASAGACGGPQSDANEPQTARDKQLQDAKASGEVDPPGRQWGGWRYQGSRNECFYVVGRRCYKSDQAACSAACRVKSAANMCAIDGGGPATVSCKKKS